MTAFLEDAPGLAIFNFEKTGFVKPPADYFIRPLMVADQKDHKRGRWSGSSSCMRGLPPTAFISSYIKEFAERVSSSYPSFLMSWLTTVGHDDFNGIKVCILFLPKKTVNKSLLGNTNALFVYSVCRILMMNFIHYWRNSSKKMGRIA
jgi:hypothetical protein